MKSKIWRDRKKNETKKKVRIIHYLGSESVEPSQVILFNLHQNYFTSLNEMNLTRKMLNDHEDTKKRDGRDVWGWDSPPTSQDKRQVKGRMRIQEQNFKKKNLEYSRVNFSVRVSLLCNRLVWWDDTRSTKSKKVWTS